MKRFKIYSQEVCVKRTVCLDDTISTQLVLQWMKMTIAKSYIFPVPPTHAYGQNDLIALIMTTSTPNHSQWLLSLDAYRYLMTMTRVQLENSLNESLRLFSEKCNLGCYSFNINFIHEIHTDFNVFLYSAECMVTR